MQHAWSYRPLITEPLVVEDNVRSEWDLHAALIQSEPGNLFPSRVGWAAANNDPALLPSLDGLAASGWTAYPAQIVSVPKSDRSLRPAADLATEDQILLSALVGLIRARAGEGLVAFTDEEPDAYDVFERYPLTEPDCRYVVEADAASFFQYVDYERLARELIGLTGWSDAVQALIRLLEIWMGDVKGIPQGPQASRTLADIYISPVARQMARAGWRFSRYSDDFRIVAKSWGEARRAHYALEEALWSVGLVPAANKARTWRVETYRGRLEKADVARLEDPAARRTLEEVEEGPYAPDAAGRIAVTGPQILMAQHVLGEQIGILPVDAIGTKLIRRSLLVLGSGNSPFALQHLNLLLARYPHLTQATAGYIRLLLGTDAEEAAVDSVVRWIQSTQVRLPWQLAWLFNALLYTDRRHETVGAQAAEAFGDVTAPWAVHGQAALAMAVHGSLPRQSQFVSTYEISPPATRPDLIAAVAISRPRWATQFLEGAAESRLFASVARLDPSQRMEWL